MEKENVEKTMEEYRDGLTKIEGKDKENDFEINKINLHIERLEEQKAELNPISEKALYEEYDRQIKEAKKELESLNKVETPENRKQKEIEKMNLKDATIKKITQANINIDKAINEAQLGHEIIMNKISNFELKYDENHIALNGNEQRELFDKSHQIIDRINYLKEAKTKCEEYLAELKLPSKEVETINSILNGTYDSKLREATEKDLEVEDKKEKEEVKVSKEEVKVDKEEKTKESKIDLDDIDFTLPKEEQKKSNEVKVAKKEETKVSEEEKENVNSTKVEPLKTETTKGTEENKIEDVKTIYIDGKKSEIYINKDKKNPIKIEYSDDKDITINKIVKDAFYVVPKAIKKLEESLKDPNISEENKKINEQLLETYKKQQEKIETKYIEFQYADPNIVTLLKNNPEQLQKYADALNGNITKKDFPIKLEYNIRGISKSEMSDEEKQQIEDYAFIHRNIAKVKKTPLQTIKFAFKGLLEKFRKVKALPAGDLIKTAPVKEEISNETKEKIQQMIEDKKTRESNINSMDKYILSDEEKEKIDKKMQEYANRAKEENEKAFQNLPKEKDDTNVLREPDENDL